MREASLREPGSYSIYFFLLLNENAKRECYSDIKKEQIMPLAATGMDLEIIILSGVSQKGITWYHVYVDSNI